MLRIRMMRFGRKHQPSYRVVVLPRGTRSGRSKYVESLGWVDPIAHKNDINKDRANYWLGVGAQPSDTVWNLFVREGIVKGDKRKKGKAGISKEVEEPTTDNEQPTTNEEAVETASKEEVKEEESPAKEEAPVEKKKEEAKEEKDAKEDEPAADEAKEDTSTEETKKEGD